MANELKWTTASAVTVSSDSNVVVAGGISANSTTFTLLSSANHSNYPLADAMLNFSCTSTVSSANNYINLYRRDMNISSTFHETTLSTVSGVEYRHHFVGAFIVPATTAGSATFYCHLTDIPIPPGDCEFYIENKMAHPVGANWVLVVTPKSYVPGS